MLGGIIDGISYAGGKILGMIVGFVPWLLGKGFEVLKWAGGALLNTVSAVTGAGGQALAGGGKQASTQPDTQASTRPPSAKTTAHDVSNGEAVTPGATPPPGEKAQQQQPEQTIG